MIKTLILSLTCVFIFAGCTQDPGTPSDPTPPPTNQASCGIEQCHGLDVTCGSNVPEACTMEYRLGDFCRQFVTCSEVDNQCQRIEDPRFAECRSCVESCQETDPLESFNCEDACRQIYESPTE